MEQENKKFYWIKLRTDFFNQDTIDFLLQQENGCEYVVLYQMLCLSTANSNGRLETKINEVIIPYDIKKIVRDCRYFDYDTVVVALELYKKLGLIYETDDKILKLTGYESMVGSESASKSAIKKREYRAKLKEKNNTEDNIEDKKGTNCPTENRDKSIEYRDKNIDIEKKKNIIKEKFETFWKEYPKKISRAKALAWFEKNCPDDITFNLMLNKLKMFKQTTQWQKDNGQFIPYATTWLNQKRWEDELDFVEEENYYHEDGCIQLGRRRN